MLHQCPVEKKLVNKALLLPIPLVNVFVNVARVTLAPKFNLAN